MRSAVFSPNGTRIVTASDDDTAKLWDTWTFEGALDETRRRVADRRFTVVECVEYDIDPCPAGQ